jgi:predicted AlkP superfamily pyrophosphatase or phosphodiesterase
MPKKDKLALYIFIDALGWEVIKERPFLNDLARTKEPLGTIFGYSSSCDPSILTGKLPQEHEHFSFLNRSPNGVECASS